MAAKYSPEQLRKKKKKLIKQANAEESRRQQVIGKLVVDFIKKEYQDFDAELFKLQANEIWENGKIKSKSLPLKQKQIDKSFKKPEEKSDINTEGKTNI